MYEWTIQTTNASCKIFRIIPTALKYRPPKFWLKLNFETIRNINLDSWFDVWIHRHKIYSLQLHCLKIEYKVKHFQIIKITFMYAIFCVFHFYFCWFPPYDALTMLTLFIHPFNVGFIWSNKEQVPSINIMQN